MYSSQKAERRKPGLKYNFWKNEKWDFLIEKEGLGSYSRGGGGADPRREGKRII